MLGGRMAPVVGGQLAKHTPHSCSLHGDKTTPSQESLESQDSQDIHDNVSAVSP